MFCASVTYPITEGGTFDLDYFVDRYVPMFVGFLGDNCARFEVRRGLQTPGAPAPTYVCVANFWVRSGEEFAAALQRHGEALYGDIPKFTNIEPIRGWDAVISSSESVDQAV